MSDPTQLRFEPPSPRETLVVANISGGKDSTALSLYLAELGIEHRRVFSDTGWEHADTYRHLDEIEKVLGTIERVKPVIPMADLIRKKGMFPGRTRRFCTTELKVKPLRAFMETVDPEWKAIVAVGIRADESATRAKLGEWEHDGNAMERWVWHPLIRWTLDDVIAIHRRHGLRPNPLYLRGTSRVGCWPCLYARKAELRLVADETPERIDEIRGLEAEARVIRERRMEDPEYAAKAEEEGYLMPTFFTAKVGKKPNQRTISMPIDKAVAWSRTSHGGRQVELFDMDPDAGCMRWGLCEHGRNDEASR